MQTPFSLGKHQLSSSQILQHLMRSPLLCEYLRSLIITDTLAHWQQTPHYQSICAQAEPPILQGDSTQIEPPTRESDGATDLQSKILQQYQQMRWGDRLLSYFLARKEQLDRAIFSAIEVDSLGMAQEIYLRIKDRQQSFAKLAKLYSQGKTAKIGGTIGPVLVAHVHPDIAYHLLQLKQGELSPLLHIDNYHVFIRLEQMLPARFDEGMKSQLREELFEQWLQTEVTNRISTLDIAPLPPDDPLELSPSPPIVDFFSQRSIEDLTQSDSELPPSLMLQSDRAFDPPTKVARKTTLGKTPGAVKPSVFFDLNSTPVIDRSSSADSLFVVRQIVAFLVFFAIFLGGGVGAFYLFHLLTDPIGLEFDPDSIEE